MLWFKKKKKKEKKTEEETPKEEVEEHPQDNKDGYRMGMYCDVCGYMEVNEESNALPLAGFALCPNCGAPLKQGWFLKTENGYTKIDESSMHAIATVEKKKNSRKTGGHYRVRKPGPGRRKPGNPVVR